MKQIGMNIICMECDISVVRATRGSTLRYRGGEKTRPHIYQYPRSWFGCNIPVISRLLCLGDDYTHVVLRTIPIKYIARRGTITVCSEHHLGKPQIP